MANYCANRIVIEGTSLQIEDFAQDCLSLRDEFYVLDFEKICPTPTIIQGLSRHVRSKLGGKFSDQLSSGLVGMEALLRKLPPATTQHTFQARSVLDHDVAKKAGIRNYDDLNAWLGQNDPTSLTLGRRCLDAYETCGDFFIEDWISSRWGCDLERIQYDEAVLYENRYEASFSSAWAAPEGIFREIARRHPELKSRFLAIEEGNDYSFLLVAENNTISETRPSITDALIDEVNCAGEVEQRREHEKAFYEAPSVLDKQPMRHFRYWLRERQLKRAITTYPIYHPPHSGIEWMMLEAHARENFDHLMAQRTFRIDTLRGFLAQFDVSLSMTNKGKLELDRWLVEYGALLFVRETGASFFTHRPEWSGDRLGYNVIFDIALYIGEFAITESPSLRWEIDLISEKGRERHDERFQRPVIGSSENQLSFPRDVIHDTYNICRSLCEASYMRRKPLFSFGSSVFSRHFVTKTLQHIHRSARGDFETANDE